MRGAEEIGSQLRALYPGSGGEKCGKGQQKGGPDQQPAHKAESGATQTIGEAKTDGSGAAAKEPAKQRGNERDRRQDEDEGDQLGECGGGEQVAEIEGEITVPPEGDGQTEDEAGEVEGRAEEAVDCSAHERVGEQCSKKPVKRIEVNYQGWVRFRRWSVRKELRWRCFTKRETTDG